MADQELKEMDRPMPPNRLMLKWSDLALRVLWCVVLAAHAWVMTAYWWPSRPHGFPVAHLEFWVNEALPWILTVFCLIGIALALNRQNRLFRLIVLTIPMGYASATITGLIIFPRSATEDLRPMFEPGSLFDSFVFQYGFWLPLLLCGVVFGLLAGFTFWREQGMPIALSIAAVAGTCLSLTFLRAQRSPDPSTHPIALAPPPFPEDYTLIQPAQVSFGCDASFDHQTGRVQLRHGGLEMSVRSALVFSSTSLDRCWSMFRARESYKAYETHFAWALAYQDAVYFQYEGRNRAFLRLSRHRQTGEPLEIETWTYLPEPVFSHHSSFLQVSVRGSSDLSISLSPFPGERFELRPHSHPIGWIDQGFAFLDAHGGLHWAKGTREEKGPFQYLVHSRIERGDPIVLTIFNEDRCICRITVYDWGEQASVALSPTAGWGVPVNAITACVGPESGGKVASIVFSLAATHIGTGTQTVGHKAGAYRNRIIIEPLLSRSNSATNVAHGPSPISALLGGSFGPAACSGGWEPWASDRCATCPK